VMYLHIYLNKI